MQTLLSLIVIFCISFAWAWIALRRSVKKRVVHHEKKGRAVGGEGTRGRIVLYKKGAKHYSSKFSSSSSDGSLSRS
jgi:hypothetical protein